METNEIIETESFFDGHTFHREGPYRLTIRSGKVATLEKCTASLPSARRVNFLLPSLAECHCHLFLDGDEREAKKRTDYLLSPRDKLLSTARENVARYRREGISVIRDAGDVHGINRQVSKEAAGSGMHILAAGVGIRRRKRYGSFMANEVETESEMLNAVKNIHALGSQAVKIILTGIIDFENGVVKGGPQFSVAETKLMVTTAHELGLKTFAHCSGVDGLRVAVESGIDSIEHGFFMENSILEAMAEQKIAWCPTFIPVHFQWANPHYAGWNDATVERLAAILDNHRRCLVTAHAMGVEILAGSDGGSFGVRHTYGLYEELALMRQAGLPIEAVLRAATLAPREHFGLPSNAIVPGAVAHYITSDLLPGSLLGNLILNSSELPLDTCRVI